MKTETKKYELTTETMEYKYHTLHRIRALRNFAYVKAGELGGWIESEDNLSHEGDCWVYDEAKVHGLGALRNNVQIYKNVEIEDGLLR